MLQENMVLSGIRVVEFGNLVSGPYCARLLGDAGAEVIKVEPPRGDDSRHRGPFPDDNSDPERSGLYISMNFNKYGITLDVASQRGRQILMDLLRKADVFVVNNDAKTLDEMGLLREHLREVNERLIVTAITPYGLTGPYRNYKGDDLTAVNLGGLAYATPGMPDMPIDPVTEPPLRANTYMSDIISGLWGALATQAALMHRELLGGPGCQVDVSQTQAVAALLPWEIANAVYAGPRDREPVVFGSMPNVYMPCADGYVVIAGFLEHHWIRIVKMMGNPEWADSEVFSSSLERARNWDILEPFLREWAGSRTGQEITKLSQQMGVPCIHAHTVGEAVESAHMKEREFLLTLTDKDNGEFRVPGFPIHLQQTPWQLRKHAPHLGEHNIDILQGQLGYSKEDMAFLSKTGVI